MVFSSVGDDVAVQHVDPPDAQELTSAIGFQASTNERVRFQVRAQDIWRTCLLVVSKVQYHLARGVNHEDDLYMGVTRRSAQRRRL